MWRDCGGVRLRKSFFPSPRGSVHSVNDLHSGRGWREAPGEGLPGRVVAFARKEFMRIIVISFIDSPRFVSHAGRLIGCPLTPDPSPRMMTLFVLLHPDGERGVLASLVTLPR